MAIGLLSATAGLALGMAPAAGEQSEPPSSGSRFTLREASAPADRSNRPRLVLDREILPRTSRAYRRTRSLLPDRFREHETRRFVILSDADERWTRTQAERLERAHHQFQRFARRLGLTPDPLRHKLVCVLFDSREDYRRFALEHDEVADPRIAGYYAPGPDRIVFYHVESNPSLAHARERLDDLREQVDDVSRDLDTAVRRGDRRRADSLRHTLNQYRDHLAREQMRVDEFADRVSVTTTIHEAVHQLLFHSRLQSRHLQYPLWICEGLATSFETETPNEAFGPDHEFDPRRDAFREMLSQGELLPLRQFVTLTTVPGEDEQTMSVIYHQSYALVTWLYRVKRDELQSYLELMRSEPSGVPSQARQLELFEAAFGDVDVLDAAWRRYEQDDLARVGAADDLRRVLLNDAMLARLEAWGAMRPEAMQRLRHYATTGQVDAAPCELEVGKPDPSTTVTISGILND